MSLCVALGTSRTRCGVGFRDKPHKHCGMANDALVGDRGIGVGWGAGNDPGGGDTGGIVRGWRT